MDLHALYARWADTFSGVKTLLVAAAFVTLGLVQELQAIDLKPFLTMVFGEEQAAKLMIVLPVVFILLRIISTGPIRFRRKKRDEGF